MVNFIKLFSFKLNGAANLCVKLNISLEGAALKRSPEKYFRDQQCQLIDSLLSGPLCCVQKDIFFIETKVLVENWH